MVVVAVAEDCKYYVMSSTAQGDKVERCKLDAAEQVPFACPEGCLFYTPRGIATAGWEVGR